MPASDRLWTGDDYTRAAASLDALAKTDPGSLPRLGSPVSGPVFAHIIDFGNLKTDDAFDFRAGLPILQASGTMLDTYLAAHRAAPSFSHEMAALQAFTVGVSARIIPAFLRLEVPKTEPGKSKGEHGKAQVVSGLAEIVGGLLTSFEERTTFDADDRIRLATSLETDGLVVVAALPHLTQVELCGRVERIAASEPADAVKVILHRAHAACPMQNRAPNGS